MSVVFLVLYVLKDTCVSVRAPFGVYCPGCMIYDRATNIEALLSKQEIHNPMILIISLLNVLS